MINFYKKIYKSNLVSLFYRFASSAQDIKRIMNGFQPTNLKDSIQMLDQIYKYRQFLVPNCPVKLKFCSKVQLIVYKSKANLTMLRIYQAFDALKLMTPSLQDIFFNKIIEALPTIPSINQFIQMSYFLISTFPHHDNEEVLSEYSTKIHDAQQKTLKFKNELEFLQYMKVERILDYMGFTPTKLLFPKFEIQKVHYKLCLQLLYNLSFLHPNESILLEKLIEKFLEGDSVEYDKILHKIEFQDNIQYQRDMVTDSLDSVTWKQINLLAKAATNVEFDIDHQSRINQLIYRKLQSQNTNIDSIIIILQYIQRCEIGNKNSLAKRLLQSLKLMDLDELKHNNIGSIIKFLSLVHEQNFNEQYFSYFEQIIYENKYPINERNLDRLKELYRTRPKSKKLIEFFNQ